MKQGEEMWDIVLTVPQLFLPVIPSSRSLYYCLELLHFADSCD